TDSCDPRIRRVQNSGMKIAIDGPAASGKTTLARGLAESLGFLFVPTGAMYRAAALARLRGLELESAELNVYRGGRIHLQQEDVTDRLSSPELDKMSSRVAVDPQVRAHLVARQRAIAETTDVVMEGRDIGTVVLPDAEVKFYLWAEPGERALRRQREQGGTQEEVLAAIMQRDERDTTRAASPLRPAGDAHVLDNTGLTPEQSLAAALRVVEEHRARETG
ncbi:MAG: (d)CMP kinase, partial [Candidatus Bipolaricaulota bacterium]